MFFTKRPKKERLGKSNSLQISFIVLSDLFNKIWMSFIT